MNLYDIIGVTEDVSQSDLKAAYRSKSKELHPDVGGSEEAFKELVTAYRVLSDPDTRAHYDQTGGFDDKRVITDEQMAINMIAELFAQCLQTGYAYRKEHDFVVNITNIITQNKKAHEDNLGKIAAEMQEIGALKERIIKKSEDGSNIFVNTINNHVRSLAESKIKNEKMAKAGGIALDMLDEYKSITEIIRRSVFDSTTQTTTTTHTW